MNDNPIANLTDDEKAELKALIQRREAIEAELALINVSISQITPVLPEEDEL